MVNSNSEYQILIFLTAIILIESVLLFRNWIVSRCIYPSINEQTNSESQMENELELPENELITRDSFIFNLIKERYEFEWDRSKILDSKASKMIGFTGVIITLETTVLLFIFKEFSNLLILPETVRSIFFFLILLSIICLFCSAITGLLALYIKKWPIVPNTTHLIENYTANTVGIRSVMGATGKQISDAISKSTILNNEKAILLKIAYVSFLIGIIITMAILYILVLVVYPQKTTTINQMVDCYVCR